MLFTHRQFVDLVTAWSVYPVTHLEVIRKWVEDEGSQHRGLLIELPTFSQVTLSGIFTDIAEIKWRGTEVLRPKIPLKGY